MTLSTRPNPYIIPEYSLTGDLLSYLNCGLQYRYYNKGALPPAIPVQLWFGEFIHGVLEESYRQWAEKPSMQKFDWKWKKQIRPIEMLVHKRLEAAGLSPPPNLFCPFEAPQKQKRLCVDKNHPHKVLASERTEAAVNTWCKHLFPLIQEAEVQLKDIQPMLGHKPGVSRSNYYGVTGRIDVLSSVNLRKAPSGNLILHYLHEDSEIRRLMQEIGQDEYEVIIDYKGMRRPSILHGAESSWEHHDWQVQMYAWLRQRLPEAKPVIAGIVLYLNELVPSKVDMGQLKAELASMAKGKPATNDRCTDVAPDPADCKAILDWKRKGPAPILPTGLREKRSIRIFPVTKASKDAALAKFGAVVKEIEDSLQKETNSGSVRTSWDTKPNEQTCTACDFKTHCPAHGHKYAPTVP